KIVKRIFDIIIVLIGVVFFTIPIFVLVIMASISTQSFGIFVQKRVGQFQKPFYLLKIRSMRNHQDENTFTALDDDRITKFGQWIRKYKLDELPQFFNVLLGSMSIVGPRPDVEEMLKFLYEEQKIILQMKPGLISKATLQFINEEELIATENNPTEYYLTEIWPQKVQLNLEYVQNWSFINDLKIIGQFFQIFFTKSKEIFKSIILKNNP
ncbi:MAG: sugar transferase, partial [Flavobacteriaceae bacterium]|nr:sugar transferase [Flavobacteriaceae bacterium]